MPHTVHRACTLCEATCGLELRGRGRPHRLGAARRGRRLLARATSARRASPSPTSTTIPDRLRRRCGATAAATSSRSPGTRRSTSWPRGCATIRARHGADAVGIYFGNPIVHNHGAVAAARRAHEGARHAQQLQRGLAGHEPALRRVVLPLRQRRGRSRCRTSTAPTTSSASAPTRTSRTAAS